MAQSKPPQKAAKKSAQRDLDGSASGVLSEEERTALREYVQEQKSARRGSAEDKAAAEVDLLAKIAEMADADRSIAERLHDLVKANAPGLTPKLWYGMPAYANADGQVICFFQNAQKFKTRYATLGFSDKANLDDGSMWPTAYALKELTAANEAKVAALVKKAAS